MNRLVIKSDIKNIALVESLIDDLIEKYTIASDVYANLLLAVVEGVNNAIVHGNKSDKDKDVTIEYDINDERIQFSIRDEGLGFNYSSLPDPTLPENVERTSGRGIFLMKHLADEVEFNDPGNDVILSFKLVK